jgi:dsRNA-specific ribonuclease
VSENIGTPAIPKYEAVCYSRSAQRQKGAFVLICLIVNNDEYGRAYGPRKKDAAETAAEAALNQLAA